MSRRFERFSFRYLQEPSSHRKKNIVESFIYPTAAQLDCSKNVKIYITIYMRGAATCFGFPQPSSGSYCMCFAKVISINNQLKYIVYRITDWINMQPLDRTDSVNDVF